MVVGQKLLWFLEDLGKFTRFLYQIDRYGVITEERISRRGRVRDPHKLAWDPNVAEPIGFELWELESCDKLRKNPKTREIWEIVKRHVDSAREFEKVLDNLDKLKSIEEILNERVSSGGIPRFSLSFKENSLIVGTNNVEKAYTECVREVGHEEEELLSCIEEKMTDAIKEAVGDKKINTECIIHDKEIVCKSKIEDFLP